MKEIATLVKSPQLKEVVTKTEQLQQQLRDLQKENEQLVGKLANQQAGDILKMSKTSTVFVILPLKSMLKT